LSCYQDWKSIFMSKLGGTGVSKKQWQQNVVILNCSTMFVPFCMVDGIQVGGNIVYYNDLKQHLIQFFLQQFNAKWNRVWKGMWVVVLWSFWNQRNGVVFKGKKVDPYEILSLAQLQAWSWMKRKITNSILLFLIGCFIL